MSLNFLMHFVFTSIVTKSNLMTLLTSYCYQKANGVWSVHCLKLYLNLVIVIYDDQVLNKGELQIAGKERESQLSSQFRDIATIVMEKTINPETDRPYTINMIERLMHEVHFAVDPHKSSKQQVKIKCFSNLC
jgi:hypothetical protein